MKTRVYVDKYGPLLKKATESVNETSKIIVDILSELTKDAIKNSLIGDSEHTTFCDEILNANKKWNRICESLKVIYGVNLSPNFYLESIKDVFPEIFEAHTLLKDISLELFSNKTDDK